MKTRNKVGIVGCILVLAALFLPVTSAALPVGELLATLKIDNTAAPARLLAPDGVPVYGETDNIAMILNLENPSNDNVYPPYGFGLKPFFLWLRVIDPDGVPVAPVATPAPSVEPGPPMVDARQPVNTTTSQYVAVEAVEVFPGGDSVAVHIPNLRVLYPMGKIGRYTAQFVLPARFYHRIDSTGPGPTYYANLDQPGVSEGTVESNTVRFSVAGDRDCDGAFFPDGCATCPRPDSCIGKPGPGVGVKNWLPDCNDGDSTVYPGAVEIPDGKDNDCDPATPDPLSFTPPKATIEVAATFLSVANRTEMPGVTISPLADLPVKVVDQSPGSCAARFGSSWQNYKIIWDTCPAVVVGFTGANGQTAFLVDPGSYLVVAHYSLADNVYMFANVGTLKSNDSRLARLKIIQAGDGRLVPAQITRITGSELLIMEPEYLDGRGTNQVLLPVVLEDISGAWNVRAMLHDHSDYNASNEALSAGVDTGQVKTFQFTLTRTRQDNDQWEAVKLDYKIVHKGKVDNLKSRISVRIR